MRRSLFVCVPVLVVLAVAAPAIACGGLIGPNGAVNLGRTTTLAGYAGGVEHYVTAFTYAGEGGEFGSLVPLPGIPTNVERGGDWTLQRLVRETRPRVEAAFAASTTAARSGSAEVILETKVDALDITVLRGGGEEVGRWATEHGFRLPPDAPEVLDFYARRSPIFMAAVFDASAAAERGQQIGDGTPIHLTIPTDNPWVPLRILALGKAGGEIVEADVYLLTERKPALLPVRAAGLEVERRVPASAELLRDLRSDKGGDWVRDGMWLTHMNLFSRAEDLRYDLAVDASGRGRPSRAAAGLPPRATAAPPTDPPVLIVDPTDSPPPTGTPIAIGGVRAERPGRFPVGVVAVVAAVLAVGAVPVVRRLR